MNKNLKNERRELSINQKKTASTYLSKDASLLFLLGKPEY